MANLFINNQAFELQLPTSTGGSVRIPSGKYVKGDYFAQFSQLTAVADTTSVGTNLVFTDMEPTQYKLDLVSASTAFTVAESNTYLRMSNTGGVAVTLPAITAAMEGTKIVIDTNPATATVTVTPSGSDTVNGGATYAQVLDKVVTYTPVGTDWVIIDTAGAAGAGGGTVTSVALTVPAEFSVSGSPVTTTGTLAVSKATQNANLVFAGPASGGAAAPTFRAMAVADLPAFTGSAALDFGNIAAGASETLTITVTGAAVGDPVILGIPHAAFTAGLVFTYWVSAPDTVSVQCTNTSAAPIDPASATFNAVVINI